MAEPDDVDAAYAALTTVEEGARSPGAISMRDLYRYVTDGEFELTSEQRATLTFNAVVRRSYRALCQQLAVVDMPLVAAASDGDVLERVFNGAQVRLTPSSRVPQFYLGIVFDSELVKRGPLKLHVEGPSGITRRVLPAADDLGEVQIVLDPDRYEADRLLLSLLRDPRSVGAFVAGGA